MIAEMEIITIAEEHRELPGDTVASPFQRRLRACLDALAPQRCHLRPTRWPDGRRPAGDGRRVQLAALGVPGARPHRRDALQAAAGRAGAPSGIIVAA
jgi:hypothetical protein